MLKVVACVALMAGLLPDGALAGKINGAASSSYQLGVRAFRLGQYRQASQYFSDVISGRPEYVNARYYRALSEERSGESDKALLDYRFVVRNGSEQTLVDYSRKRVIALSRYADAGSDSKVAALVLSPDTIVGAPPNQMTVPLKTSRNALLLNATLLNQSHQAAGDFIVDTGATYTSISQEMAKKLGLDLQHAERISITTANGRIEVPRLTIEVLNVNGLEARNVQATVIPIRPGSNFSGLLGLSFLRKFIVTIDSEAGHLILARRATASAQD